MFNWSAYSAAEGVPACSRDFRRSFGFGFDFLKSKAEFTPSEKYFSKISKGTAFYFSLTMKLALLFFILFGLQFIAD